MALKRKSAEIPLTWSKPGASEIPVEADRLKIADSRTREKKYDRRRELRERAQGVISVLPCRSGSEIGFQKANLTDRSAHGIAFTSPLQMSAGEQFIARLDLDQILFLVYTTRNCRRDAGKWKIGAELFGIVGGTKDDPNQILKILVSYAIPAGGQFADKSAIKKRK